MPLAKGLNHAANIGHSALRTFVMGERAFGESANDEDLAAISAGLEAAVRAGAHGFTTSRTEHHQTSDDRPVASRSAEWTEVQTLVGLLSRLGAGIFQIVQDAPSPEHPDSDQRLIELTAATGVLTVIPGSSHRSIDIIDATTERGDRMVGITHPRGIGSMSTFGTQLPFDRLPVWRELRARPLDAQAAALRDPEVIARLVQAAHDGPDGSALGGEARPPAFDRMRVVDQPLPPNPTVAEAAARVSTRSS